MFVYKQYDQQSLDKQYNTRLRVPDYADYLNRWEALSRDTEQQLTVVKDLPYGSLPREKLDIYPSVHPRSKTLVFIHGGYWHLLDKSMFQFIAAGFHSYDVTTVLLTYPLAPEATIDQIVSSCRKAIQWLYNHLTAYNGDPYQIYLAGHSAGGHLAAMMMATHWPLFDSGLPPDILKGVCTVSGLFNLIPVHLSYVNAVVRMDKDTAVNNSPINFEPSNPCPLIVAVGTAESEEFIDQSTAFYTGWKNNDAGNQFLGLPALNHYSIVETIADPQSPVHQAMRRMMKIE